MNDNYGYSPQQGNFDPTVSDSFFPQPMQDFPDQPPLAPPSAPVAPNAPGNLPTVQPVYVPYPVVVSDNGDSMALSSLILGIISAAIGWIPVCGVVALAPAILGIVFGGLGFKSRRRRGLAIAGMVLSILAIAMAFIFFI